MHKPFPTSYVALLPILLILCGICSFHVHAQDYTNTSSTFSGAGGIETGESYTNCGTLGEGFGGTPMRNGTLHNYGGFPGTFIVRPCVSHSSSRFADELNPDNDGDGLSDYDELSFGANLLNPDSDSDGMKDGDEVIAGTGPTNSTDLFKIESIGPAPANNALVISWNGVSGRLYTVIGATNVVHGAWTDVTTLANASGTRHAMSYTNTPSPERHEYFRLGVRLDQ